MSLLLHSLILLPPPPKAANPITFRAAYYPPLQAALKFLANLNLPNTTILEITLPIALADTKANILENFYEIERLLSGIYSLVSVICATESIETEGPGGVDARVILLSDYAQQDQEHDGSASIDMKVVGGPIVDYSTLAITRRKWKYIFTVDGEVGKIHANRYLDLAKRITPSLEGKVRNVSGGLTIVSTLDVTKIAADHHPAMKHKTVAVGGTFDHLHAGHKLLLTATAMLLQHSTAADVTDRMESKRLIVGITGDELLKNKKYREYLASWEERARDVTEFLKSILLFVSPGENEEQHISTQLLNSSKLGPNASRAIHTVLKPNNVIVECVEIQDPFGPTITDETITGLAVSGETRSGGNAINEKRAEHGWQSLEVFEIAVLDSSKGLPDGAESSAAKQDFASKISSSEIRKRKAELARLGKKGSSL